MPIDYVSGPNYFLTCPYGEFSPAELFEQIRKILEENKDDLRLKPLVVNLVGYTPTLDWDAIGKVADYFAEYKIYKMALYVPNNEYLAEQCRILDTHLESREIPSRTFKTLKKLHQWLNETE